MESIKRQWFRIPSTIRKPLVLVIGLLLVIISPFTGVLPGPGGIPVFLIGVAILSTEFEWARRFRDWSLAKVRIIGEFWRNHKVLGSVMIAVAVAIAVSLSIFGFRWMQSHL